MSNSESLAHAFAALTQAADDRDIDLATQLRELIKAVEFAVSSYLGMTLVIDSHEVSVTALEDDPAEIATSLKVGFARLDSADPAGTLTLYASTPGAFVDLAADLTYALDVDHSAVILDQDLTPSASADARSLDGHTTVNRAIGALIERGHTPESANLELKRLTALGTGDPTVTAEAVLRTPRRGSDRDH
jgi:hypothetical protein